MSRLILIALAVMPIACAHALDHRVATTPGRALEPFTSEQQLRQALTRVDAERKRIAAETAARQKKERTSGWQTVARGIRAATTTRPPARPCHNLWKR
jgi:hypothetical protein